MNIINYLYQNWVSAGKTGSDYTLQKAQAK